MNEELLTSIAVETFLDRWMNEPGFPGQLRNDPRTVLASLGFNPTEELVASLMNLEPNTSFEDLKERISKGVNLN